MGLSRTQRLLGMTTLSTCLCLTELAVGVQSGSLALVVDSVHLGSDVLTLLLSAAATAAAAATAVGDVDAAAVDDGGADGSVDGDGKDDGCGGGRRRRTGGGGGSWWWRHLVGPNTWGAARAEVLAAFANAVFLIAVALNMAAEAVERLAAAEPVARPRLALAAALGGMVVNAAGMVLFTDWTEEAGGGGRRSWPVRRPPLLLPRATTWSCSRCSTWPARRQTGAAPPPTMGAAARTAAATAPPSAAAAAAAAAPPSPSRQSRHRRRRRLRRRGGAAP